MSITTIIDACELLLGTCYNNSMLKKISRYADELSPDEKILSSARNKYQEETNIEIKKIQNMNSIHQVATSVRHCSVEVQYFIFERIVLIRCMAHKYPEKYSIVFNSEISLYSQLSYMLLALWEYTVELCNNNLNSMISQCYRGLL